MRHTKRKDRILEILTGEPTRGICLLNELREKCRKIGEFHKSKSKKSDQRKSFSRSVFTNDDLFTYQLTKNREWYDNSLTVGLYARWAIWELIEKGYLSNLPEPDEMLVVVGKDACSAFIKLKNGHYSIVGTAIFMTDIYLVSTRELIKKDLYEIANIPWAIKCYAVNNTEVEVHNSVSVLSVLPKKISLNDGRELSTAKIKFKLR